MSWVGILFRTNLMHLRLMPKHGAVLIALLSSLTAPCAFAGNLLQAPGFDTANSIASGSWEVLNYFVALGWASAPDHAGDPGSGSIHAQGFLPNSGIGSIFQCVPVTAGTAYYAGAWVLQNSGAGSASFTVTWYSNADCTGQLSSDSHGVVPTNFWIKAWKGVTSPATAQSAQLRFLLCNVSVCDQSLDDAFFTDVPVSPVGLQSFGVD